MENTALENETTKNVGKTVGAVAAIALCAAAGWKTAAFVSSKIRNRKSTAATPEAN
jgi:hypothetical protein